MKNASTATPPALRPIRIRRLEKPLPPAGTARIRSITPELARDLSLLSHEIRRQIGLLINRQGRIVTVVVGDTKKIVIPDRRLPRRPGAPQRAALRSHPPEQRAPQPGRPDRPRPAAAGPHGRHRTVGRTACRATVHVAHVLPGTVRAPPAPAAAAAAAGRRSTSTAWP
ncbi:MAG: hypothetical protein MZV70_07570 [Desulfobacterales bacterium]|nr:hypothetical protein [Desulfobacterales bacterium]